jgi:hypothetical protein
MSTSPAQEQPGVAAASRFFWLWLFTSTSMSVAGNVTHAIINAPRGAVGLAAAAAVVPPAVLLGSTHSVAVLVKTRRLGASYWCALLMTVALAGCAFVLSFDALRDLAVSLGFHPDTAWLWPVAIDVSIAQSTLALLTLTPRGRIRGAHAPAPGPLALPRRSPAALSVVADAPGGTRRTSADRGAAAQWKPTADQLVREGVTSKDADVVAAILAEHAAGTPPSTIGRRQNVHHSTVNRILSAARGVSM